MYTDPVHISDCKAPDAKTIVVRIKLIKLKLAEVWVREDYTWALRKKRPLSEQKKLAYREGLSLH